MTSLSALAKRALMKLQIIGPADPPAAEDRALAIQKLKAVHAALKIEDVLRWTLNDIPDFAEEPYVMMAAFLMAPEYEKTPDPNYWTFGMQQMRKGVQLQSVGPVAADYF